MENFYNALNEIEKNGEDVGERGSRALLVYRLLAAKGCASGAPWVSYTDGIRDFTTMVAFVEGLVAMDYRGHAATVGNRFCNIDTTILVFNGEGCATKRILVDQHPDKYGNRGKALVVHAKASDTYLLRELNPRLMVVNNLNLDGMEQMESSIMRAAWRDQGLEHIIFCVKPSQMDSMPASLAPLLAIRHFHRMVSVAWREIKDLVLIHQAVGRLQGLALGHPSLTPTGTVIVNAISGHTVLNGKCDEETQTVVEDEEEDCVVCQANKPDTAICNCGHKVLCQQCVQMVLQMEEPKCPICNAPIVMVNRDVMRIYP